MAHLTVLAIDKLKLQLPEDNRPSGTRVLEGIFGMAQNALERLSKELSLSGCDRGAAISRLRGTGPGVSFGRLIAELERDLPIELQGPFENSDSVSGAVWEGRSLLDERCDAALLKLRFEKGALDLPLHTHERSDRFIMALDGRGFFHVSDEPADKFTGRQIRTVPVRSRDVLMFTRRVVHTFSAPDEPLVLLSYHAPFIPLTSSDQYLIPGCAVLPRDILKQTGASIVACDPAWSVVSHCGGY